MTEDASPQALLGHLQLMNKGRLMNAAVLLYGKSPQRFLITSEIRCAHIHGTEVAKPIHSCQVNMGTVFDLVDLAVEFVLSKNKFPLGTLTESVRAVRCGSIDSPPKGAPRFQVCSRTEQTHEHRR